MPPVAIGCVIFVFVAMFWVRAEAQTTNAGRGTRHIDLAIGGGLFTGSTLGAREAALRGNSVPSSSSRLFSTDTRLARSPFVEGWLGYPVTRRVEVEGRLTFGRPELQTSITGDIEGAPSTTAVERLDQYLIEGGIAVALDEWRFGRTVPFIAGGAGYLRQRHEGQILIEEGHSFYVGGGVKYLAVCTSAGVGEIDRHAGRREAARPHRRRGVRRCDNARRDFHERVRRLLRVLSIKTSDERRYLS